MHFCQPSSFNLQVSEKSEEGPVGAGVVELFAVTGVVLDTGVSVLGPVVFSEPVGVGTGKVVPPVEREKPVSEKLEDGTTYPLVEDGDP